MEIFCLRIPEMVVTKYQASHAEPLKALQDKISQETNIQTAVKTHTMSSAAAASGGVTRTLASPDWDGNPPWNWRKSLSLSSIAVADFDTANTCLVPVQPILFRTFLEPDENL